MARRAHALVGRPTIEDSALHEAWAQLLGSLARQPAPPPAERLKAAIFQLAQVRLHTAGFAHPRSSQATRRSLPAHLRLHATQMTIVCASRHGCCLQCFMCMLLSLMFQVLQSGTLKRSAFLQDRIDEAEGLFADLRTHSGMQASAQCHTHVLVQAVLHDHTTCCCP